MNQSLVTAIACIFLFFGTSRAIDEQRAATRADALITLLSDQHLQPADITSQAFLDNFFTYFIRSLDPDMDLFSQEDEVLLRGELALLQTDLQNKQVNFLRKSTDLYRVRLAAYRDFASAWFNTPFEPKSLLQASAAEFEKRSGESDLSERWKKQLRYFVLNTAFDGLDHALSSDSVNILVKEGFENCKTLLLENLAQEDELDYFFEDVYLNAIAMAFDPHSSFFDLAQEKQFEAELSGSREIFGFSIDRNSKGTFFISNLVPGSAAWNSGELGTNDVVLRIRFDRRKEFSLRSMTLSELNERFAQSDAKVITLTLEDEDHTQRQVTLEKQVVSLESDLIRSAILSGSQKVGYITLPDFYTSWDSENMLGCANDVAKAILKMQKEHIGGLILDLRGNGGGSMKEAVDLVGIFINYGPVVVSRTSDEEITVIKDFNRGAIYTGPLIVLIDGGSASASEIVAAALQDHRRAVIVGQRSFGKSTGQTILPIIPEGSLLTDVQSGMYGFAKVTMDGLYRIDLSTHQKSGVKPDVELPTLFGEEYFSERDFPNALELQPIEKKVYYDPLPAPDVQNLQSESQARLALDSNYIRLRSITAKLEKLMSDDYVLTLSVKDMYAYSLEIARQLEAVGEWKKGVKTIFETQNIAFDEATFSDGSIHEFSNSMFLRRLALDQELNEAYRIMLSMMRQ